MFTIKKMEMPIDMVFSNMDNLVLEDISSSEDENTNPNNHRLNQRERIVLVPVKNDKIELE